MLGQGWEQTENRVIAKASTEALQLILGNRGKRAFLGEQRQNLREKVHKPTKYTINFDHVTAK